MLLPITGIAITGIAITGIAITGIAITGIAITGIAIAGIKYYRSPDVLALRLCVVFRRLLRLGSFPACWRQANVTPIPKGPIIKKKEKDSSSVATYRPISNTSTVKGV